MQRVLVWEATSTTTLRSPQREPALSRCMEDYAMRMACRTTRTALQDEDRLAPLRLGTVSTERVSRRGVSRRRTLLAGGTCGPGVQPQFLGDLVQVSGGQAMSTNLARGRPSFTKAPLQRVGIGRRCLRREHGVGSGSASGSVSGVGIRVGEKDTGPL